MGQKYRFFLGGHDLEMLEIRRLLERHAPGRFCDKNLAWGTALSAYNDELLASLERDEMPVLIELADDLPPDLFRRDRVVVVDHHGPLAGRDKPTSIEQVFALLRLPAEAWTRHLALVAANDRAHVAGMRALGATPAEIAEIRAADRAAQGVTAADEADAVRAIEARQQHGRLTVVASASGKCSPITDRLVSETGGPGYQRLLVVSPDEVNFFGDGAAVELLSRRHRGSWHGGDLPRAGFWGMKLPARREAVVAELIAQLR